jgi:hypothetical protein
MNVAAGDRPARRLAGAMIVLALTAGCTDEPPEQPRDTSTAEVAAGQATTVSADDVSVTVPPDGADAGATLQLRTAAPDTLDGPALDPAISFVGRAAVVDLEGSALETPASVTFPLPEEVDGRAVLPIVLWEDGAGAWAWLPAENYSPGDTTITATTDHFSGGVVAGVDVDAWAQRVKNDVTGYLTGRSNVAQPSCGDERAARAAGLQVTSSGGDSVKWCVGVEGGRQVVKIANNRRTFTQITYPVGWRVLNPPTYSISLDALNRAFSTGAGKLTAPRGTDVRVIDGGSTLTLAVPPGARGNVLAEVSVYGWLLSALKFGLETFSAIAAVVPRVGAAAAGSWNRVWDRLLDVGADDGVRQALLTCGRGLTDLTDVTDVADLGRQALKFGWDCVPALAKADIAQTGIAMFAVGLTLAAIGVAVGFVLSAAHLLITGIREIWDSVASFGGRSNPIYTVALRFTPPPSAAPAVATAQGFGAVRLGMTAAEVRSAVGSGLVGSQEMGTCTVLTYRTSLGDATAYVHAPEGTVLAIQTPRGAKTDRGVGYADNLDDLRAAYGRDHAVEIVETQAGGAAVVTTGDPSQIGFGNPGGLIGFVLNEDGEFESAPMVGGVPGFEYCSG